MAQGAGVVWKGWRGTGNYVSQGGWGLDRNTVPNMLFYTHSCRTVFSTDRDLLIIKGSVRTYCTVVIRYTSMLWYDRAGLFKVSRFIYAINV